MKGVLHEKKIFLLFGLILASGFSFAQVKLPVPVGNPLQLFYLQRSTNTNTIICELNNKEGVLDLNDPVHVYWLRYADQGQKSELSFLQRKFAYGVKSTLISKDKYELHFVSYKKLLMYLIKGPNNKYNVFTTINQKQAILNRIFVKIDGGTLWAPNVEYVEMQGVDPVSGRQVVQRLKI